MKKLLALVMVGVLVFVFVACENKTNNDTSIESTTAVESSSETTSEEAPDWKQFLSEYEAWVDDYIEFMKKYEKNPSDLTLLSEYATMASDMTEWAEKSDEVSADLENASPAELSEYTAELTRILNKLTAAMQ